MPTYKLRVVLVVNSGDFNGLSASPPQTTYKAIGSGDAKEWQRTRNAIECANYMLTVRCLMIYYAF